jgi:hypothetical protein
MPRKRFWHSGLGRGCALFYCPGARSAQSSGKRGERRGYVTCKCDDTQLQHLCSAGALRLIINWHHATVSALLLDRLGARASLAFAPLAWLAAARAINFDDTAAYLAKIVAARNENSMTSERCCWNTFMG